MRALTRTRVLLCLLAIGVRPSVIAEAAWPSVPPPLPAPTGPVINVSTEPQLQAAVRALSSNTTILIAPGTYRLTSTLWVNGTFANVCIRGATNSRDDAVLVGPGMTNASYGNVPYGIWVGGNVQGITIANLTIRDLYYHPIILNQGAQSPRLHNVHLINAGEQFVKGNPDGRGGGVDNGVVEYSVIEYETTSRDSYTNGVDVHTGDNWIIRHNLFRNIRAPQGQLAGPAILMWNGSTNTLTEGNTFIDCQREIAYGLQGRTPDDHTGGIIRNNFIYRNASIAGDAAVGVFDSPGTQVLHNTILASGTYRSLIEYRFPGTTGVLIANNLLDGSVLARDGATGTVTGNDGQASASMFVNPTSGDLHLLSSATSVINRAAAVANCPDDWDGQPRPQGAAPDTGADEYVPGPVPPIPPRNVRVVG